jgi:uncharacterized protein YndB with AHSA1/START domain
MKTKATGAADPGMSDAAVQVKTGKNWAEWCALLDEAGASRMTHKEIAAYLHDELQCSSWWSQMVTVGYERLRGLREKNQAAGGYQMSATRTIPVSMAKLYRAWTNPKIRERWLPAADFTVRKATPKKSLRLTWSDGNGSVEVQFYAKGEEKCQVNVSHTKLPNAGEVARLKEYWGKALDRLKDVLVEKA